MPLSQFVPSLNRISNVRPGSQRKRRPLPFAALVKRHRCLATMISSEAIHLEMDRRHLTETRKIRHVFKIKAIFKAKYHD